MLFRPIRRRGNKQDINTIQYNKKKLTSGQSNLIKGRIAAEHGSFSRILYVAPHLIVGSLGPHESSHTVSQSVQWANGRPLSNGPVLSHCESRRYPTFVILNLLLPYIGKILFTLLPVCIF